MLSNHRVVELAKLLMEAGEYLVDREALELSQDLLEILMDCHPEIQTIQSPETDECPWLI